MTNIIFNTISVECGNSHQEFCLYWQDGDGNHSEFICAVYGFENAIRVANGIAHEQVEFVKHACFDPNLDPDDIAELQSAMQENADERYQLPH
tara:strand:- start:127 stop:405 length:279 start_codon:yes stop_codon:yes gene_type:complete